MGNITLVKIKELEDALHKNNIEEGFEVKGAITEEPKIGDCFYVFKQKNITWFRTSTVMEIIDKDTFKTVNSIYKIIR